MLSIVIPTFRQVPRLRLALASVVGACAAEEVEAEIVVVDDAGEPEVAELVRMTLGRVPMRLLVPPHGGRSVARNEGARAASGRRLLFLDGDVLLTPGTLRAHHALAAAPDPLLARGGILRLPWLSPFADPAAGTLTAQAAATLGAGRDAPPGLSSRTVRLDERGYADAATARLARANQFERDIQAWLQPAQTERGRWLGVTGAHFSINRDQFFRLGGFDEEMGRRWGAEDLELGFRAELAGVPIVHLATAAVLHMDHEIAGRDGDHDSALGYFARKHGRPGVLRLLDYFAGRCSFAEVASA